MDIKIVKGDITKANVDAIVNANNSDLSNYGGISAAIFKLAGSEMEQECKNIGSCKVGKAVITKGYKLPSKYVIHAIIANYSDKNSTKLLSEAYKNSIDLANTYGCNSVAFHSLGTGKHFGFPLREACEIAI